MLFLTPQLDLGAPLPQLRHALLRWGGSPLGGQWPHPHPLGGQRSFLFSWQKGERSRARVSGAEISFKRLTRVEPVRRLWKSPPEGWMMYWLGSTARTHTHAPRSHGVSEHVTAAQHAFHQIRRNFKRASGGNTANINRAGDEEADGTSGSVSGRLRLSGNMQVTAGTDSGAAASPMPQLISSKTPGSYWEGSF